MTTETNHSECQICGDYPGRPWIRVIKYACPYCEREVSASEKDFPGGKGSGINLLCPICRRSLHIPSKVWCPACGNGLVPSDKILEYIAQENNVDIEKLKKEGKAHLMSAAELDAMNKRLQNMSLFGPQPGPAAKSNTDRTPPKTADVARQKSTVTAQISQAPKAPVEGQKKTGCWVWPVLLIGGLLFLWGCCIGSIAVYGQISGTSGTNQTIGSYLIGFSFVVLLPFVIGCGMLAVGIYALRKKGKPAPNVQPATAKETPKDVKITAPEQDTNLSNPKLAEAPPPAGPAALSALRLADPSHPARKQIVDLTQFLNETVEINVFGNNVVYNTPVDFGEVEKITKLADEGIGLAPSDDDLKVAKAGVLQAVGQFKTAEETLDIVLKRDPNHFEARTWKDHWGTWGTSWKYPYWDEQQSCLHPMMSSQFKQGLALQVVRDGVQKAIAIVAGGPPYPMDSRTQVKVKWILSKTPYGSILAYYVRILEPAGEPHTMEMFLAPRKPSLFAPTEGYFLLQQLAFAPYCFVVLADQEKVALNRKVVFGSSTAQEVYNIARQVAEQSTSIDESQIKSAYQWHMNNFDMNNLKFE
jgi:hypothetical protein